MRSGEYTSRQREHHVQAESGKLLECLRSNREVGWAGAKQEKKVGLRGGNKIQMNHGL